MTKYFACFCLQRVLMPIALIACIVARPCLLSGLYLLLLLCLPNVPIASPKTYPGHTAIYLRICVVVAFLTSLAQIAFQAILLWFAPYGHFLHKCEQLERILRYVGLIRYDGITVVEGVVWILPEILALLSTILVYVLCGTLSAPSTLEVLEETTQNVDVAHDKQSKKRHKILTTIGRYLILIVLCITGSLRPSIPAVIYFLTFLTCCTWWACNKSLKKGFGILLRFIQLFAGLHLMLMFLYQMQWFQEILPSDSLYARLFDLKSILKVSCENPRFFEWQSLEWTIYVNSFVVYILFYLCAIEATSLRHSKLLGRSTNESFRSGRNSKSSRRSTVGEVNSESIPLDQLVEDDKPGILESILLSIFSILYVLIRSSYLAANIIMMVWSITYHSWLTFVLLLWSNVLWLFPNQRKSMLRSSPFIVIYAELLLLSQYIYSMDLNEDELPSTIQGFNMEQIGFTRPKDHRGVPLMIKSLYTVMFWITMRQYMQERQDERRRSTIADMVSPLQVTMGAATASAMTHEEIPQNAFMNKAGKFLKSFFTRTWIWIVAFMLFLSGITGNRMTGFRIAYMALFLIFVSTFQISWKIWRKCMYAFWLTVIIFSMAILVMVYTYQFDNFPRYWSEYLHIPETLQHDIGLELYATRDLFVRLLTPTFFVIITVIQLHYFHRDFLELSNLRMMRDTTSVAYTEYGIRSEGASDIATRFSESISERVAEAKDDVIPPKTPTHFTPIKENESLEDDKLSTKQVIKNFLYVFWDKSWLFLELHSLKLILILIICLCCFDVGVIHFMIFFIIVVSLPLGSRIVALAKHISIGIIALMLLLRMIYQIDYIKHETWNADCDNMNQTTKNLAEWIGFEKVSGTKSLAHILRWYIALITLSALQTGINIRQAFYRFNHGQISARPHLMFPEVNRGNADSDTWHCIKFFLNYGFYKFGVELTMAVGAFLIMTRMDFFALLYGCWLLSMCGMHRTTKAKIWPFFITFIIGLMPIQYLMAVGTPPNLCLDFFWSTSEILLIVKDWLFLIDDQNPPPAKKIIWDFLLLLIATRQQIVFRIEERFNNNNLGFPGGNNRNITKDFEIVSFVNPTPDYVSTIRNWLDIWKRGFFLGFLWFSLAIMFLSGTREVNVFSIGYLVGTFIFLWQGPDLFLRPIPNIVHKWVILMYYNVSVMIVKCILQGFGCIYVHHTTANACWFVQLAGIRCFRQIGNSVIPENASAECVTLKRVEYVLLWDFFLFICLLIQKRIFTSYYFFHIVDEAKAMTILASRGAELFGSLRERQKTIQKEKEAQILEKIRKKMDRIKANQRQIQGPNYREPSDHYVDGLFLPHRPKYQVKAPVTYKEAVRSGDYYMFDHFDDQDEEEIEIRSECSEDEYDDLKEKMGIGEFITTILKTDAVVATEKALGTMRRSSEPGDKHFIRRQPSGVSARSHLSAPPTIIPSSFSSQKEASAQEPLKETAKERLKDDLSSSGSEKFSHEGDETDHDRAHLTCREKIIQAFRFIHAFAQSCILTVTVFLNRFSRHYRFVSRVLTYEKKLLKEQKIFRVGIRRGSGRVWEPIPESFSILQKSRMREKGTSGKIDPDLVNQGSQPSTSDQERTITPEETEEMSSADQFLIFRLILAAWFILISNTEYVCYFAVFLYQIKSASIISLPLPLMVFLWGSLAIPRPTTTFWITMITYTEVIVIIKCIFQFDIFPWNQSTLLNTNPYYPPKIFGIEKSPSYATYDLILLLVIFIHRAMLRSLGLWEIPQSPFIEKELNIDRGSDTSETISVKKIIPKSEEPESSSDSSKDSDNFVLLSPSFGSNVEQEETNNKEPSTSKKESVRFEYVNETNNIPQPAQIDRSNEDIQNEKTYDSDEDVSSIIPEEWVEDIKDDDKKDKKSEDEKQETSVTHLIVDTTELEPYDYFPGIFLLSLKKYFSPLKTFFRKLYDPSLRVATDVYAYMFICDFFNFMVIIFGFASFGTQVGDGGVSAYLKENKVPIPFLLMLILQFMLIIVDRALFLKKFILGKIIFQFFTIFGIHIWMFFVLPAVTERAFNTKLAPQMWYMMKCFYLLLSAYQIRSGYPTRILGNFLCKSYNYVNMILFKGFMLVPFLFELRTVMDWMCTDTSMTVFDWLKMEDIFANIFQLKCTRHFEDEFPQKRGAKKVNAVKYLIGGAILMAIIAIIWFPLVIFALGNTVGEPNIPYDVTMSLKIEPYQPIYQMTAQGHSIEPFTQRMFDLLLNTYAKDRIAQSFLSNYEYTDVATITLNGNSTMVWTISPPDQSRLIEDLTSETEMWAQTVIRVTRKSNNKDNPGVVTLEQKQKLDPKVDSEQRINLIKMLRGEDDVPPVKIPYMLPKYAKITNIGMITPIKQLMEPVPNALDAEYRNITVKLYRSEATNVTSNTQWWEVREDCTGYNYDKYNKKIPNSDCNFLQIYSFNEKMFPETLNIISGGGIIGLYTTLVFVASRVIRGIFSDIYSKIMFEDLPNVDRILQLCLDIYLVREAGELMLEEDLFAKLVFLYRSPETLIKWTRPKEEEDEAGGQDEDQLSIQQ